MARVGLVFGGRSVEHLVSVQSARTVAAGLEAGGHTVVPLGIAEDGCWVDEVTSQRALGGELRSLSPAGPSPGMGLRHFLEAKVEVVFPIVHGTFGEDGTLQGLCELLDLPYVGAGVAASALAMDKLLCKRALEAAGVPVVEYATIHVRDTEATTSERLADLESYGMPLFVKPSVGGSSVGVQRVGARSELGRAVEQAMRFHDVVLVERGVKGRELECAVLGNRRLEASVIGEIVPGRDFYDYEDKYLGDTAQLIAPADLPENVARELRTMAVRAFEAIGGEGMARVDFFLEGEKLYVNEINTLPGFTSISMYPRLWGLSGLPLPQLIDRLVGLALERHADRRAYDDSVRSWVHELEVRLTASASS
ncbi:MAG: D-alanine--D-alanine ligase family protein [Myxococcota bacterium]